jgi:hypothetical protein
MDIRAVRAFFAAFLLLVAGAATAAPPLNLPFDKLEQALELTPEQKEQFDVAVGATKRMMLQMALAGMQLKERLAAELQKPRPRFEGLADELRESFVEQGRTLRREARDEWRKLYRTLNADQVAAFQRFVDERLDLGALHDFMIELILGRDARERT